MRLFSKKLFDFKEEIKKLKRAIGRIALKILKKENQEKNRLFDVIDVDQVEHLYDHITLTSQLCDQLLKVNKERIQLLEHINEMSIKQESMRKVQELSKEKHAHIKNLWESLEGARKEKNVLRHKLSEEGNQDLEFTKFEQNIPKVMDEIQEAEERQRNIQSNINYLEGEKGALIYSKEKLERSLKVVKGVAIGTVAVAGLSAFVLFLLSSFSRQDILVPSAIMIVAAIFISTWIYIFQRYIRHEIKRNVLTQGRAVELLNKQKIQYVNVTNFLEYEYKKFNVRNGDMLQYKWEQYEETRKNQNRYRGINTRIFSLENQLENELKKLGIPSTDKILRYIPDLFESSERKISLKELKTEIKEKEKNLEQLEEQQQFIWEQLNKLQQKDVTEDKIVEKLIQKYLDDMQNFMKTP